MTQETRKKAKSVTIVWEDNEEETLKVGDRGDVFVAWASEKADRYTSTWSGGISLFQAVMASAIEFRTRLHVERIREEDRQMVDAFIKDVLGDGNDST